MVSLMLHMKTLAINCSKMQVFVNTFEARPFQFPHFPGRSLGMAGNWRITIVEQQRGILGELYSLLHSSPRLGHPLVVEKYVTKGFGSR